MIKNNKICSVIFLLILSAVIFSCKKDESVQEINTPPIYGGYDKYEAAVNMTLAAIAYVADGYEPAAIKDTIINRLENTSLATGGDWKLAWGPGVSGIKDNLVYVAVDSASSPMSYAIVIRGTNTHSIDDIVQDLQAFHLVPFKYGANGDSVAYGSMRGLDSLLNTHDEVTGKSMEEFLLSLPNDGHKKMYITGHSQGGALAPLMGYWFIKSSGLVSRFDVEIYAFAGPSVSNKIFKTNFTNAIPGGGSFHMVANSLDLVPFFWARQDSLIVNSIPTHVPTLYREFIIGADKYLASNHIRYAQLADQIYIGSFPPKDTVGTVHPSDSIAWYNYWALVQHNHNNYLKLLNSAPVN